MEHTSKSCIFAKNRKKTIMLGVDKKELPKIKGKYVKEMREALYRSHKGNLNASEKEVLSHSFLVLSKYESEWE